MPRLLSWHTRALLLGSLGPKVTCVFLITQQIYMGEAQRLWTSATGEEAPEVKLMESIFRHMAYRLDSTEAISVCGINSGLALRTPSRELIFNS
jgi:hypothetical protein